MLLADGTRLGPYEILAPIGAGGMGEVYRARDTRLDRTVAIKILAAEKLATPDRRQRFIGEAKAASALNHPNIVTIYDVGEDGNTCFISMEYVQGKTLGQLIPSKGMRLEETLRIAIQVADALAKAHAAGIIHRDLKPGNVMVTGEGTAKLLDFGLAKLVGPSTAGEEIITRSVGNHTPEGIIVGTAGYMSPEQAKDWPLDARSDIFSFGALLYEMATGRRAFLGDSTVSTLAAVLNDEPQPVSELIVGIPSEFERVIRRCLRKDPARRFQTMADLAVVLRELKEDSESGRFAIKTVTAEPPRPGRQWIIAAAVLLSVFGAGAWLYLTRAPAKMFVPKQLTTDGLTMGAAISRDGKLLAYGHRPPDRSASDIWVRQIPDGEPIRITNDPGDEFMPSFSPDSTEIAFQASREGGGIYVVPALGGESRLVSSGGEWPAFSPVRSEILCVLRQDDATARMMIAPAMGGEPQVFLPDYEVVSPPVWSPDGTKILFKGRRSGSRDAPVDLVVPREGGQPVPFLTPEMFADASPMWWGGAPDGSPRQWLYLTQKEGDAFRLVRLSVDRSGSSASKPEILAHSTDFLILPAVAADGRLVFSSFDLANNLWEMPIDADRTQVTGPAMQITSEYDIEAHSISRDGARLAFDMIAPKGFEIHVKDLKTRAERRLTQDGYWPSISPDGSRVVFSRQDKGQENLYIMPFEGGIARKVSDKASIPNGWKPDGTAVLCRRTSPSTLYLVDIATGEQKDLIRSANGEVFSGFFSADGEWIIFGKRASSEHTQLLAAPFRNGTAAGPDQWVSLTDGAFDDNKPQLSPNGKVLYFTSNRDGFVCVWFLRLDPKSKKPLGPPAPLQHYHGAQRSIALILPFQRSLHLSVASDRMLANLDEFRSDVWMIETR
jgi:eukaryotic-like serine/threonine-protein kinase